MAKKKTNNTKLIEYDGKTQSQAAWARETGLSEKTIGSRLDRDGYSVEDALTSPPKADVIPARQLRAELMQDVLTFHREHGQRALLEEMKSMATNGEVIKLYLTVILPLLPKDEPQQIQRNTTAVNVINHIPAEALTRIRPVVLEGN